MNPLHATCSNLFSIKKQLNEAPRFKMVPPSGVSLCNILKYFPIPYAVCCAVLCAENFPSFCHDFITSRVVSLNTIWPRYKCTRTIIIHKFLTIGQSLLCQWYFRLRCHEFSALADQDGQLSF